MRPAWRRWRGIIGKDTKKGRRAAAADAVAAAPHVTEKNRRKAAAGNRQWFPAVDGIGVCTNEKFCNCIDNCRIMV